MKDCKSCGRELTGSSEQDLGKCDACSYGGKLSVPVIDMNLSEHYTFESGKMTNIAENIPF